MDDSLKTDFFDRILIVLVIYKMKLSESPTYQSLTAALNYSKKSAALFIYNNSAGALELMTDECWRSSYYHDPSNSGVSKAYNDGFKKAKELRKTWLLLVDQDTTFPIDIFEKYATAVASYPDHKLFSPVVKNASSVTSPFRLVMGRGVMLSNVRSGPYSMGSNKFINSGLLVSTDLYFKCGGYDEHFPLDFSDLVFAERAQEFADEFVVIEATCNHSLSSFENSFEVAINRFRHFTSASKAYGQLRGLSFILFINRCLRSIKLSYRFKSLAFLKTIIQG